MTDLIEPAAINSAAVNVANAGTRVALGVTAIRTVIIKANKANTGIIYVGGVTVTAANGFPLDPGQQTTVSQKTLATIYIDASVNTEGVRILLVS